MTNQAKRTIMFNLQSERMHLGGNQTHTKRKKCIKCSLDSSQQQFQHQSTAVQPPLHLGEAKVVKEWIEHLKQSECHFGEAIFVLGPMGAGKSTVVTEEFKKDMLYNGYAYVDTDEVMEQLEGFDSTRVEEFYPIARSAAIRLTDWLLDEKISFIAEGTCVKYEELVDYMYRLKHNGYVIKVKHVNNISLEEILRRAGKRKRKIPDNVVRSIYYGSLKGVNELKKKNADKCLFEEL